MKKRNLLLIFGTILILIMVAVVLADYTNQLTIQNVGAVKTLGVDIYSDEALTTPLTEINWGLIAPGETKNAIGWIKNTGNAPIILETWTDSQVPDNLWTYFQYSWNYDNPSPSFPSSKGATCRKTPEGNR